MANFEERYRVVVDTLLASTHQGPAGGAPDRAELIVRALDAAEPEIGRARADAAAKAASDDPAESAQALAEATAGGAKRIYVASSWRNAYQPAIVARLREAGHEVYDFRHPAPDNHGFHWSDIDPDWKGWSPTQFREALKHPVATDGFACDFAAMRWANVFVLVLPCGRSAHLEAGWALGAGKPVGIYIPEPVEPELMYLTAGAGSLLIDERELLAFVAGDAAAKGEPPERVPTPEEAVVLRRFVTGVLEVPRVEVGTAPDDCESEGWTQGEPDPNDPDEDSYTITPAGRTALARFEAQAVERGPMPDAFPEVTPTRDDLLREVKRLRNLDDTSNSAMESFQRERDEALARLAAERDENEELMDALGQIANLFGHEEVEDAGTLNDLADEVRVSLNERDALAAKVREQAAALSVWCEPVEAWRGAVTSHFHCCRAVAAERAAKAAREASGASAATPERVPTPEEAEVLRRFRDGGVDYDAPPLPKAGDACLAMGWIARDPVEFHAITPAGRAALARYEAREGREYIPPTGAPDDGGDVIDWRVRALAAEVEVTRLRAALERATRPLTQEEYRARMFDKPWTLTDFNLLLAARRAEAMGARCTWPGEDHARGCERCDPDGNHEGHVSPACREEGGEKP